MAKAQATAELDALTEEQLWERIDALNAQLDELGPGKSADRTPVVYRETVLDRVDELEQLAEAGLEARLSELRTVLSRRPANLGDLGGLQDLIRSKEALGKLREAIREPARPGHPDLISKRSRAEDEARRAKIEAELERLHGAVVKRRALARREEADAVLAGLEEA